MLSGEVWELYNVLRTEQSSFPLSFGDGDSNGFGSKDLGFRVCSHLDVNRNSRYAGSILGFFQRSYVVPINSYGHPGVDKIRAWTAP